MQLSMPKEDPSEEYVSAIRAAGLRAKDLVSQILAFSRKRPANLLAIELAAPVTEALKLVRASAPATVELQASLAPGAIFADPTQIYRVVVNLCSNAIHALHDRCGRVSVEVAPCTLAGTRPAELHKLPPGDYMRLSVADNGHGMDAETLRRVFDPFFTTKAPGEGTGLGLAIVRNIVEGHGGAIHVRSEAGVGTTFELYFARTKEAPSAGATHTPVITAAVTHEVLVVDDEPAIVSYVSKRLAREGYRCATFADPGEALAVAQANPKRFDAIVTDLTMPRLTGVQLLQRLHREGPSLPSVIITGFSRELPETELATLPPCVVLQKPFTGDELVAALAQLLRPANPDARAGVVTAQVRER
jgi:CheY-like chemotaxis protein